MKRNRFYRKLHDEQGKPGGGTPPIVIHTPQPPQTPPQPQGKTPEEIAAALRLQQLEAEKQQAEIQKKIDEQVKAGIEKYKQEQIQKALEEQAQKEKKEKEILLLEIKKDEELVKKLAEAGVALETESLSNLNTYLKILGKELAGKPNSGSFTPAPPSPPINTIALSDMSDDDIVAEMRKGEKK